MLKIRCISHVSGNVTLKRLRNTPGRNTFSHHPIPLAPLLLALPACVLEGSAPATGAAPETWEYVPDLPISSPPYEQVHASWKQRLDVPYVYFEHRGSYADTGALIPVLQRELRAQGLEVDGAPFALFYDDPARVPASELRSRACVPIRGPRAVLAPLHYDSLPSTTVGYAFVSGNYPEVPRAYPGVFAYLARMGWQQDGPVREIYLVPPGPDPDPASLLCEVQIPAAPRAR